MEQKLFLSAAWRNLVMINYKLDKELLAPYVPAFTEIDTRNGSSYLSLVGFLFRDTRVLGLRIPFHVNFEEVNLRFYVKRKINGEERRGVVFISEIVPRAAIAIIANNLFHENYRSLPMKHSIYKNETFQVSYEWKHHSEWNSMKVTADVIATSINADSVEEFITEHYWGYNKISASKTTEYQVNHPRWKVHRVSSFSLQCDFARLYGNNFDFLKNEKPDSVFLAEGSEVTVKKGVIIHS